jgi:hypothetical protein
LIFTLGLFWGSFAANRYPYCELGACTYPLDIDQTLVENSGVSREIYTTASTVLAGAPPTTVARTSGRTDRLIMRSLFEANDIPMPLWDQVERALELSDADHIDSMRRAAAKYRVRFGAANTVLVGDTPEMSTPRCRRWHSMRCPSHCGGDRRPRPGLGDHRFSIKMRSPKIVWASLEQTRQPVPYGFYEKGQQYLDTALDNSHGVF